MTNEMEIIKEILREILKALEQIRDRILVKEEVKTIKAENLPIKKHNAPKIVLGVVYKIAAKKCDKCKGLISWDDYDANTHRWPTHVNESGQIIGDGSCPEANF